MAYKQNIWWIIIKVNCFKGKIKFSTNIRICGVCVLGKEVFRGRRGKAEKTHWIKWCQHGYNPGPERGFRKGVFGKGGVLGEGVLRRGCLGEGVLGEEEKHRKTIGVRVLHQHGYNTWPEEGV